METLLHEVLIHGLQDAKDYSDNGLIDHSNINPQIREAAKKVNKRWRENYMQHYQERYYGRRLEKYGLKIIREIGRKNGIHHTDKYGLDYLYDFMN